MQATEILCPECASPLSECNWPHMHALPKGANVRIGHAGHIFGETTEEFYRRVALEAFRDKIWQRMVSRRIAERNNY